MSKGAIVALIIGVIIFCLGGYQNVQYEEHSVVVDATVTDIKTVEDNNDEGPISYKHTYYGDYTVNGKKYTDKKLDTKYTSSHISDLHCGDTIEVRVYPDRPETMVAEGGLFIIGGAILITGAIIVLVKSRKKAKANQPNS